MGYLIIDNSYIPLLMSLIEQAKKEILISTFKIQTTPKPRGRLLQQFYDRLILKARAGVKIRLLINWHDNQRSVAKTNLSACQFLKSNMIEVRHLKNNRCCHAKTFIVDREKAVVGSHNLSVRSCEANFEVSYLIPDPESVAHLSSVFLHSWSDGKNF